LPPGRQHFQLLDVSLRDDTGISFLQLALDVKIVGRLLIGALGFLDLAVGFDDVRLRRHQRGVDLGDLAASGFQRRFLLRAVELEDDVALFTGALKST
jgi:hypothetical protein